MSNCIFNLVKRLVQFTCLKTSSEYERKIALGPTLKVLFHCLTLPEYNRFARFKMDVYGAILCLIEACNELTANENREAIENYLQTGSTKHQNGETCNGKESYNSGKLHNSILRPCDDSLEALLNRKTAIVQSWTSIFNEYSHSVVKVITSDVEYAPFAQKNLAMTCLSEIQREGRNV